MLAAFISGVAVALFASNCKAAGATVRYAFLEELMRYIKVHVNYSYTLPKSRECIRMRHPIFPQGLVLIIFAIM